MVEQGWHLTGLETSPLHGNLLGRSQCRESADVSEIVMSLLNEHFESYQVLVGKLFVDSLVHLFVLFLGLRRAEILRLADKGSISVKERKLNELLELKGSLFYLHNLLTDLLHSSVEREIQSGALFLGILINFLI